MFIYKSIKFPTLNSDSYCLHQDFEVCAITLTLSVVSCVF